MYALRTTFFACLAPICTVSRRLVTFFFASELRRKFIKSALLSVGLLARKAVCFFVHPVLVLPPFFFIAVPLRKGEWEEGTFSGGKKRGELKGRKEGRGAFGSTRERLSWLGRVLKLVNSQLNVTISLSLSLLR